MLSAEALERKEGMWKERKGGELSKTATFYILICVWRLEISRVLPVSWVVSLGLVEVLQERLLSGVTLGW